MSIEDYIAGRQPSPPGVAVLTRPPKPEKILPEPYDDDLALKTMYEKKAQSSREYDDEMWERIKTQFKSSINILKQELRDQVARGEWDD